MTSSLYHGIIVVASIVLILLLLLVYLRSRRGDQRMMQVINQMFLPLVSAIVLTIGVLFYNGEAVMQCASGLPNTLRYVAVIGPVILIGSGFFRYALSQFRDRRMITHPTLLAIMVVLAIFAIEQFLPCS